VAVTFKRIHYDALYLAIDQGLPVLELFFLFDEKAPVSVNLSKSSRKSFRMTGWVDMIRRIIWSSTLAGLSIRSQGYRIDAAAISNHGITKSA